MADLQFNPMDAEFIADPYPTYHRLQTEDPVHHSALGFWVLTRYEDVVTALRDPRLAKEAIASFVAARFAARHSLAEYFRGLIAQRRAAPRADMLSGLIAAEEAGDKLNETELLATCILLLIAGHETTVNLIGNGTLALLRHRDQLRRLQQDPTLIGGAIEELLRYDGPVQRTARIPSEDVTIGGRTIARGEMVMPFIGAADRDPVQFPEPDRLDIGRADNRHIAFGWGLS